MTMLNIDVPRPLRWSAPVKRGLGRTSIGVPFTLCAFALHAALGLFGSSQVLGQMPDRPDLAAGESNWAGPNVAGSGLSTTDLNTVTPEDLVNALLGPGVLVENITFVGANIAGGLFTGGAGIIGCESGVVLSSGNVASIIGPNTMDDTTTALGLPGDPDLDALIPGFMTQDATILEFDFTCESVDVVQFQYVFASEEYNEFVFSDFNDVFGFFVDGVNIALVPGAGSTPVAIDTVNCGNPYDPPSGGANCNLFRNNDLNDGGGTIDTEMDGLTLVFTATTPLTPGPHHIKLAIADTGDMALDSNVLVCAGTLECAEPLGACCDTLTFACVDNVTQSQCQGPNQVFSVGLLCEDLGPPCFPDSEGACCPPLGSCVEVTAEECGELGGVFQGAGVPCASTECPFKGACCFVTGGCVRTDADTCATLEGDYQGNGTECGSALCDSGCPGDANMDGLVNVTDLLDIINSWGPCDPTMPCLADVNGDSVVNVGDLVLVVVNWGECPTGACCLVNGMCIKTTAADCTAQMGAYQGDSTLCADTNCPEQCTGGIGDFVWLDENGNGIQDSNEPGISNVRVSLFLGCEQSDNTFIGEVFTDDDGFYQFTGLCAGDYLVVFDDEDFEDGLVETRPNQGDDDCKDSDCVNGRVCVNLPTDNTFDDCVDCGVKPPQDCCEFGNPVQLTFRYTGEDCSASDNSQSNDECDDFGDLQDTVFIIVGKDDDCDNDDDETYFEGSVSIGESFVAATPDGDKFPSNTYICIYDEQGGQLLQKLKIHTSCSQDLFTGDQFGSVILVDCVGEDEPQPGDCCANGNKPDDLTFQYTGEDCSASDNTQDNDECDDFGDLPDTVYIVAGKQSDCDNNADETYFEGFVSLGGEFVVQKPGGGDLASNTYVCVYTGPGGQLKQKVKIHTSCSQDLFIGNQFGSLLLVACDTQGPPRTPSTATARSWR